MIDESKIMIVDDEPDIVKIVKISMELANFGVIEAYSGEECLDKLEKGEKPALILLDIMMPGISGYEVCERIRKSDKLKSLKVAMLTAKGEKGDAEQGLKAGADDYIIKPFDPYELVQHIRELLER